MREIKCRAWDKGKKCWISPENINLYTEHLDKELGAEQEGELVYFIIGGIADSGIEFSQSTGLKDKNGKEIYECDILIDDCGHILEVKFGKLPLDKSGDCVCTYPAFYCKDYGKLGQAPFYECVNIGDWMEVIGNIYENPELLEDKKDGRK